MNSLHQALHALGSSRLWTSGNTSRWLAAGLLVAGGALVGACGSDGDTAGTSSGGSGACGVGDTRACLGAGQCEGAQACLSDGSGFGACDCGGTTGGTGGSAGSGGTAGSGQGGATAGAGGSGGSGPVPCNLRGPRPSEDLPTTIDSDLTLGPDKVYRLTGPTHIADGGTLRLDPCARVEAVAGAYLMSLPGGALLSEGEIGRPVLFTSEAVDLPAPGGSAEGDWHGIRVMGGRWSFWPWPGYEPPAGWPQQPDPLGRPGILQNTFIELTNERFRSAFSYLPGVGAEFIVDGLVVRHASRCVSADLPLNRVYCEDVVDGIGAGGANRVFVRMRARVQTEGAVVSGAVQEMTICGQPPEEFSLGVRIGGPNGTQPTFSVQDLVVVGHSTCIRYFDGYAATSRSHLDPACVGSIFSHTYEAEFLAGEGNSFSPGFTAAECFQDLTPDNPAIASGQGAFTNGSDWLFDLLKEEP